MRSDITIVIPTHNRPHYLERCVDWFLAGGYRVVVADSSHSAWKSEFRKSPNLNYCHVPGDFKMYVKKLVLALGLVSTPYVALCADDDYTLYEGLDQGVDFLDKNPDYSFCQGQTCNYQMIGTRLVVWPLVLLTSVEDDSWVSRIENSKYTFFYGVNRTENLRSAFGFLEGQELTRTFAAGGSIDYTLTCAIAREGRLKALPTMFNLREYSAVPTALESRFSLILNPALTLFYRDLLEFLKKEALFSDDDQKTLIRLFATELSGQIQYALLPVASRRAAAQKLPAKFRNFAELSYRWFRSIRDFRRSHRLLSALQFFFTPEYRNLRTHLRTVPVVTPSSTPFILGV